MGQDDTRAEMLGCFFLDTKNDKRHIKCYYNHWVSIYKR